MGLDKQQSFQAEIIDLMLELLEEAEWDNLDDLINAVKTNGVSVSYERFPKSLTWGDTTIVPKETK